MHLLHVTPCFPPTWAYGGIPRIVAGLGSHLVEAGHEVTVLTTDAFLHDRRADVPQDRQLDGMRVLTARNVSNRLAYRHQLFLPRRARSLLGSIQAPDVVHLHGHRHLLNSIAARYATEEGIPYVLTANGTLPRHERKRHVKLLWDLAVAGFVPRRASRCVAVSRAEVRQHLSAGIPADRIVHIPNGLDMAEFEELPERGSLRRRLAVPEGRPLVAYLGQISPRKGVDHLVRAFAGAPPAGALLVVGGNDMGGLSRARKAADGNTMFLGLLEGPERIELLVDADVLVYPSSDEVFGLVPFEGLLAGAPVVVGDDCGCGELVHEAGAGLLAPYGDIDGLKRMITRLLEDRELAGDMVRRGRSYIQRHLAWPGVARAHEDLYRSVMETRLSGASS